MRRMRSRRGSTLVLVALMLGACMGVAAIAADIGRFYVVTGELQTSADAAALKGVAVLQKATANYASTVDDSVTLWASTTNRSDGDSVVISPDSIDTGWWDPDARRFGATPVGERPNAVSVKAYGSPRGVFAQLIGRKTGLALERRAVAWIANISSSCTRPWALPYLPLVQKVNLNSDTTKDLDMGKFTTYANTSVANRTLILRPGVLPPLNPDNGTWTAYNLPSNNNGGGNSGSTTYQSQIANCNNIAINSDAANGQVQPSQGNGPCTAKSTVVCWAIDAIQGNQKGNITGTGFCRFVTGDATCYVQAPGGGIGAAGVTTDMTYANVVGNGAQSIDFKYVGETTLACFFTLTTDTCSAIPDPLPKTNYQPGTMVIVTQGLKSPILNPSQDVLSNAPSNRQRFVLVQ
jgi:hypothetical protein